MIAKPLVVKATKVVAKVQKSPDVQPKLKVRAHCVCILLAVILTATIPNYLHTAYLSAFTIAGPNFIQEIIDRMFHL
jgi:hypothetical protein